MKAFRSYYGKLNEVRSLLPKYTPLVALTATASLSIRKIIEERLNLHDPVTILKSPEKLNIRFSVVKLSQHSTFEVIFACIIEELEKKRKEMERIIVFCRSHRHCREMYSTVSNRHPNLKKYIAMFHSTTEESAKENVIQSFDHEHGEVRILFATIAFGMGINVKGVNNIIHLGPPSDLDDYLQESGRAGRDGSQSYAILINYPGCSGIFKTAESMKQYVKNERVCRRKLILEPFGYTPSTNHNLTLHLCCDVCAARCLCGGEICGDSLQGAGIIEERLREQISKADFPEQNEKAVRSITKENRELLHKALTTYRSTQLGHTSKLLTGSDIASGFPQRTIKDIIEKVPFISDTDYLKENFLFLNPLHAQQVMALIMHFTESVSVEDVSGAAATSVALSDEDESSYSESESVSEYCRILSLSFDSSEEWDT